MCPENHVPEVDKIREDRRVGEMWMVVREVEIVWSIGGAGTSWNIEK